MLNEFQELTKTVKQFGASLPAYIFAGLSWVFDWFMAIPDPVLQKLTMLGTFLGVWVLFAVNIAQFRNEVKKGEKKEKAE